MNIRAPSRASPLPQGSVAFTNLWERACPRRGPEDHHITQSILFDPITGICGVHKTCGSGLAREEALKTTTSLNQFFLTQSQESVAFTNLWERACPRRGPEDHRITQSIFSDPITGICGVHKTCGSGLARDEARKNNTSLKQSFFLTKNETGFRGE